ncbi:MAG TPA: hypothetical protein VGM02_16715 [Acidobacteriaceae bacterium]|jgi:hypothetical protein
MMRAKTRFGWNAVLRGAAAATAALAGVAALALAGCTVYPEQKQPALMQTTSAEQVDRIFWQYVEQAKWAQANALLAPNAVWRVNGQMVPRAQIVPWLQSLGLHGVQVSNVALTPAVNDMNLVYTVQMQADKAVTAQVGAGCAGRPQTFNALAVWQQPQPTGKAAKDKQYRGYLLTVHDLTAAGDAGCR